MVRRAARTLSLALATLTLLLLLSSHLFPLQFLLTARFDRATFLALRPGTLRLWTQDVTPTPPADFNVILTTPGQFLVTQVDYGGSRRSRSSGSFDPHAAPHRLWKDEYLGRYTVYVGTTPVPFAFRTRMLSLPLLPAFLLALLPLALPVVYSRLRGRLTARRLHAGLCPSCGYDCRATPARCPECGTQLPIPLPQTPRQEGSDEAPPRTTDH